MTWEELQGLLVQGEHLKLDVKRELLLDTGSRREQGKKREDLAFDIAAIANARGGRGYLIIGIDEDTGKPFPRAIVGLTEERVQQIVTSRCAPPIDLSFEVVDADGIAVTVIVIHKSDRKPHQVRQTGAFPIRRGNTNDVASLTARKDLQILIERGKVRAVGSTRGRYYEFLTLPRINPWDSRR